MRSDKKKKTTRDKSDDLHKSGEESDESDEEEEERIDCSGVLVTGGGITPRLPRLSEGFKLDPDDKQSRADITDLISNLQVFYARLVRIRNVKLQTLAIKAGGGRPNMSRYRRAYSWRKPNTVSPGTYTW